MAYQVLARKWRPRNFSEMAGQSHVLKTLINSLENNRLHHAYLFTGTRGVGKTTIARILARCLNCEQGVSAKPCGECSACAEIDEGRFIDLIEVDAASRTKVEDTRELLENVQYAPSRGRFKVYLIDEVHMLSTHSFNALLKTLEEPPPHVKFLLATTDPQKLPVTVLSRCLQFSLKNLSPELLVNHLTYILEQEKISFEEPALWQLGRAARGSVRDSLTLLDQAIGFCDNNITEAEVSAFLGSIDQAVIHRLVDALCDQDAKTALDTVAAAAEHSPDFASMLEELLSYFHRLAIAQVLPGGIDNSQGDRSQILAHAESFTAQDIQLYYQIALKSREDLPLAVDDRSGFEMALLRMLAFTPPTSTNSSPPTGSTENSIAEEKKKAGIASQSKAKAGEKSGADLKSAIFSVNADSDNSSKANNIHDLSTHDRKQNGTSLAVKSFPIDKPEKPRLVVVDAEKCTVPATPIAILAKEKQVVNPDLQVSLELSTLSPALWIPLFYALPLSGITQNIAANCVLSVVQGNKLTLLLSEDQTAVYNEEHKRRIESALSTFFAEAISLSIEVSRFEQETPASYRLRMERERLEKAVVCFQNDELVQDLQQRFDGSIQMDSIEPLTPKQV